MKVVSGVACAALASGQALATTHRRLLDTVRRTSHPLPPVAFIFVVYGLWRMFAGVMIGGCAVVAQCRTCFT